MFLRSWYFLSLFEERTGAGPVASTLLTYGEMRHEGGVLPLLHGAAPRVSPWLCGGGGGSQGSLDRAEPGFLQSLGNTVYQNIKLASFSDQPDGIFLCVVHSQIASALQSALAF